MILIIIINIILKIAELKMKGLIQKIDIFLFNHH